MQVVRHVWTGTLDYELCAFSAAAESPGAIVALDAKLPRLLREDLAVGCLCATEWHKNLCENLDIFSPVQLACAVAKSDGEIEGVWCFNLRFDVGTDLHAESVVAALNTTGADLWKHASAGIDTATLGRRLRALPIFGHRDGGASPTVPMWVTAPSSAGPACLLRIITQLPLPRDMVAFDKEWAALCPCRHELRNMVSGSSEPFLQSEYSTHVGAADAARAALELYLHRRQLAGMWLTTCWEASLRDAMVAQEASTMGASLPWSLWVATARKSMLEARQQNPVAQDGNTVGPALPPTLQAAIPPDAVVLEGHKISEPMLDAGLPSSLWAACAREAMLQAQRATDNLEFCAA